MPSVAKGKIFVKRPFYFLKIVLVSLFFISFGSANAEDILVGGLLNEDQTWTKEFTYIVYKDLRIPEGVTLNVQAGVTIKIDQGRGIFILGGNMIVDGQAMRQSPSFFRYPGIDGSNFR